MKKTINFGFNILIIILLIPIFVNAEVDINITYPANGSTIYYWGEPTLLYINATYNFTGANCEINDTRWTKVTEYELREEFNDWDDTDNNLFFNYTGVSKNSKWQLKYGYTGTSVNYTINPLCLTTGNFYAGLEITRFDLLTHTAYCLNNTDGWYRVAYLTDSDGATSVSSLVSASKMFDNNYNTKAIWSHITSNWYETCSDSCNYFWEEAVWVKKSNHFINNTMIPDGTYHLSIECDVAGLQNGTDEIQFTLESSYGIDNCTENNNLLINYTAYDEDTKTILSSDNASINVYIELRDPDTLELLTNYSAAYNDHTAEICISDGIYFSNLTYSFYAIAEYEGDSHVHEYDYIQNYTVNFTGSFNSLEVPLYDLLSTRSTTFLITFKDNVFLPVDDAIIEILRFYTDEGVYITVEDGLTSETGQTVGHMIEEDITYAFVVKKQGTILASFYGLLAVCQETICQINLNQFESITSPDDFGTYDNLNYDLEYNDTEKNITLTYSTLDSSPSELNLTVLKSDALGNTTICSKSLTSSSGSITCHVPNLYGNSTIDVKLYMDSDPVTQRSINLKPAGYEIFGYIGYFAAAFMYIFLPFMAYANPIGAVILSILGVFLSGAFMFISVNKGIAIGTALVWYIVAGGILIWKISKREA